MKKVACLILLSCITKVGGGGRKYWALQSGMRNTLFRKKELQLQYLNYNQNIQSTSTIFELKI